MQDLTKGIVVHPQLIQIPAWASGEELDLTVTVEEIRKVRLYSDIEAVAGYCATPKPSRGPGVYQRSEYTQNIYLALELHVDGQAKVLIPRLVEHGALDCLSLAEEIEEVMGIPFEHIDDYSGRTHASSGAMLVLVAAILGLLFS